MGKTSNAVKDRWKAANYDKILTYLPKGTREQLQAWCAAHGKTVGGLVKELLERETGIKLTSPSESE